MSQPLPLTPIEHQVIKHALLTSVGFLVLLPLGVLIARYMRTYHRGWWTAHWFIQSIVSAPVIVAGWSFGYKNTQDLFTGGNFNDPHKNIGLALFVLYVFQLLLGAFIHFVKFQPPGKSARPMQNYLHAMLGLLILALAAYQVHYGFTIEWYLSLGGLRTVTPSARKAWVALVTVFWISYLLGLALLPRQWRREEQIRNVDRRDSPSR